MIKRNCLVCNTPILGRSDKKFCSDQCRSTQHNAVKSSSELAIADINKFLRKNRTILKKLCPAGKSIVPKEALTALDFRFHMFTSILITRDRKVYYICYDFALTPIADPAGDRALIVLWKENRLGFDPWRYVRSPAAEDKLFQQ
jgi:hypothetical protein